MLNRLSQPVGGQNLLCSGYGLDEKPNTEKTRRSATVNWVTCGTCYTKTEGTELGGIEGAESGFSQE